MSDRYSSTLEDTQQVDDIRPRLDYTVQAWNQRLMGYIESLERVHRRATKIKTPHFFAGFKHRKILYILDI